ncbi:hypothetical protein [Bradyrhizobium sp. AUGA SZCCT0283]|uniref:hypothetical protein n=1 Tax=Bradyrhizobium sp. AUGA SZCCT0283 TaxID=2807671 RepID=UPI001BAA8C07|nr:hypothetical protein [Bradyrhizobium sp. AUGA SZCCT0283]MBR1280160.1 hypothetical protein [Bradyrhizobium sp. AUGA SZCCT0283]
MASASFVEIISHFAGYLQIFHDIARDRISYDESLAPRPTGDYTTLRPHYDYRFVPDDMETAAGPVPELMPDDPIHFVRGRPLKLLHGPQDDDFDFFPRSSAPNVPLPKPVGGGGGGVEHHVRVKYQDGGEQTQLTVHQYNLVHDDDVNLPANALVAVEPLIARLNIDAMATIEQLAADASAQIPANWQMPQTDGGATDFLIGHDAAWAERGGTADAHSVTPGYYVNGELQERPSEPAPPVEPEKMPDTGDGIGQWAALGNNFSINAALIVDIGEAARTMVVMGDYFKTDAIFQTNTVVDHDHISVSGGAHAPSPTNAEDVATNIADFAENPSIYTEFPARAAGPNWIVDVVDGNYYSVHAVAQVNYLSDNDVATQVSSSSHYNLVGGHNQQGNLALIYDGSIQYDLIIIKGSYHGLNVIFQNNILLNDDNIVMSADGAADPSQSVSSGDNGLLNEAEIANYGGDTDSELPGNLELIESLLAAGMTSLDPELAGALIGHGGPLKVLYITGDYYDINAIWQTNITSDVNVMYQLQNQPLADLMAFDPDGTVTQSVITGGNELANDAAIVDVNPDVTYVKGQIYTDCILVQANLMPTATDDAVSADTNALVTELIAFVDDPQDTASPPPAAIVNSVQSDPMASVLH